MSVWNYVFDSDFSQRTDIERLKDAAAHGNSAARRQVRGLEGEVAVLRDEIAELALVNRTLMRLVVERGLCSAEDLAATLREIDLEDGVADGKVTHADSSEVCAGCRRNPGKDKPRCVWCGHPVKP